MAALGWLLNLGFAGGTAYVFTPPIRILAVDSHVAQVEAYGGHVAEVRAHDTHVAQVEAMEGRGT